MISPLRDIFIFSLRTFGVGFFIYAMSRYLPRRSGGGLAAYDFVFFWMMGGLAVSPLYDLKIRFLDTLAAIVSIYFCHYLLSGLAMRSQKLAAWISGQPISVIERGTIRSDQMRKALLPLEILFSELRVTGTRSVTEVESAILETTGHISVVKKSDYLPVTSKDLPNKPPQDLPLPLIVVEDGRINTHNLHTLGKNEEWLRNQLVKAGATNVKQVYAAIWEGAEPIYWVSKSE